MNSERCNSCTDLVQMKCEAARSMMSMFDVHLPSDTTDNDIRKRAEHETIVKISQRIMKNGCLLPLDILETQLRSRV